MRILILRQNHSVVNIYFPEAFYSNEEANGVEEFEVYINRVKKMVETKNRRCDGNSIWRYKSEKENGC